MRHLMFAEDYEDLSRRAADWIIDHMRQHTGSAFNMVWPTGATPRDNAGWLARLTSHGAFNPHLLRLIQLDEFLGLEPHDRRTLWAELVRSFLSKMDIPIENVLRFDTTDWDRVRMGFAHERAIEAIGGIDLCVLGLGQNGHVGFNEPPAFERGVSGCVKLSDQTRQQHERDFGSTESVPEWAVTLGMGKILSARHRLLLVSGEHKAEIFRRCMTEPVSACLPGSLVINCPNTTIIADRAAACYLVEEE